MGTLLKLPKLRGSTLQGTLFGRCCTEHMLRLPKNIRSKFSPTRRGRAWSQAHSTSSMIFCYSMGWQTTSARNHVRCNLTKINPESMFFWGIRVMTSKKKMTMLAKMKNVWIVVMVCQRTPSCLKSDPDGL